jgi:hypothetical protein
MAVVLGDLAACGFITLLGGFIFVSACSSIRAGEITVGRPTRTVTRAEDPVDFWGFCLWFLIGGGFFFVLGVWSLIHHLLA